MSSEPKLTQVFVGNIPYDVSEEQLTSIFQEAGPVNSLRLVLDKETGRPKGFGFVTYYDRDTAASAVRNLNGYDIKGRQIKVDFAEQEKEQVEQVKRQKTTDFVSSANPQQLLDLFSQIKLLVNTDPSKAKVLLEQNPQLSYGLFQAMLVTGIVDPATLQQLATPQQQQPIAQQQQAPISEQDKQLLMTVLALSPADIARLPLQQQEDIRLLKLKLGVV